MKWFKFLCDDSEAEFESWLEDKWGNEGFAWWVKVQRIVAKSMDGTDRCSATYPISEWSRFLKQKRFKTILFLESIGNQGEINLIRDGDILEIQIPNLLKKKDEYSSKIGTPQGAVSGQTPSPRARTRPGSRAVRSASDSMGSLFSISPEENEKVEKREKQEEQEPVSRARKSNPQAERMRPIEQAIREFSDVPIDYALLGRWMKPKGDGGEGFTPEEIIGAIHEIGPPGHLTKGMPYLYRTIESKRNGTQPGVRNDRTATRRRPELDIIPED